MYKNYDQLRSNLESINDSPDFIKVSMNELGVTNVDSQWPVLTTIGIGPCTGVSIWDPISKTIGLVHIKGGRYKDGGGLSTDINNLLKVFKKYTNDFENRGQFVVKVIEGDKDPQTNRTVECLKSLGFDPSVINATSISIDSHDGKIKNLTQIIPAKPFSSNLERLAFFAKSLVGDAQLTSDERSLR